MKPRCPVCNREISEIWDNHVEEGEIYLFDCPHCGADIQARWDDDDNETVIIEPEQLAPARTGAELHRRKWELMH